MAKHPIHFFTEQSLLVLQTIDEAFGCVQGYEQSQFKVTSNHNASVNPFAYAVTDGQIFFQEDVNNTSLVNIALKPKDQHLINGYTIRFFIYRGIQKGDLVSGNNIIPNPTAPDDIDLLASIWKAQDKINNLSTPVSTDIPSQNILGLGFVDGASDSFYETSPTDYLEKFFYIKDDSVLTHNFHTWDVRLGDTIGKFDLNKLGFEIIVGNFQPTINDLRLPETIIVADDNYPTTGTAEEKFISRNKREPILNYIDPCAFYGTFFSAGVKTNVGKKKGTELLQMLNAIYFNAQKIYIDLRNRHNQSLSFYPNDFDVININVDGQNIYSGEYHTNYWPLLILDAATFPSLLADSGTPLDIEFTNLQVSEIVFHLAQGFYQNDYPKLKKKLINQNLTSSNTTISLAIHSTDMLGSIVASPAIIKARFIIKVADVLPPAEFEIESQTYIDNLFKLNDIYDASGNMIFPFNPTKPCCWRMLDEEVYVDEDSGYAGGFMAKVGYAKDVNGFYFFGFSSGDELRKSSIDPHLLSGESDDENFIDDVLRTYFDSITIVKEILPLTPPEAASDDNLKKDINTPSRKTKPSSDNIFFFSISNTKIVIFKNSILSFVYSAPNRLFIRDISPSGINYIKSNLLIGGYKNVNNFNLQTESLPINFYKTI